MARRNVFDQMAYTKEQLTALVVDYAYGYGIDPAIALEQVKRESANFRADVVYGPFVGGAGERGMSQFTPGTWQRFGYGSHTNAYDPDYAMWAWGDYMSYLSGLFDGDIWKMLAGYNGGEGNVQRGTISSAARRYANEIIARSGRTTIPDIVAAAGAQPDDDSRPDEQTNWLLIFGVGAISLIALVALDD